MAHMDTDRHAENETQGRILRLVLEENDPVLESIKRAMIAHHISECRLSDINGPLKKATLNFPSGFPQHVNVVENAHVLRGTGHFKISFGELFGHLHLSTREKPDQSGQLSQGIAGEGLTLVFEARTP